MLRSTLTTLVCLIGLAAITPGAAQTASGEEWVRLGSRLVGLTPDRDTIDTSAAKGRFKAIRLVAKRRGILLNKFEIVDGNCRLQTEERRINLLEGERTRPFELAGGSRFVNEIRLYYRTEPGTVIPAEVEVWGLQSRADARATRTADMTLNCPGPGGAVAAPAPPSASPPRPLPTTKTRPVPAKGQPGEVTAGGDVLLGVEYVGLATDRDVIRVGRQLGKFERIRLRVLDADIHVTSLRVAYDRGEPDTLAVNAAIPRNSRTAWLPVSRDRFIRDIELVYRAQPGAASRARVEVYGEYADGWYTTEATENTGARAGWRYIGGQSPLYISFRQGLGYQNDSVAVARNRGFKRMRLEVRDRAVSLNRLIIDYTDGNSQVIDARARIDAGKSYGPIILRPHPIKEIRVSWRSRLLDPQARGRNHAFVEFWVQ